MKKEKILLLGSMVAISAITWWFLYTFLLFVAPSWFDELHVRVERKWLEHTADELDGVKDQEIRAQFPEILTQAIRDKNIGKCMQLPERSSVYHRDSNGSIVFHRPSTGAVRRPHRENWLPRTECQREYVTETLDWELCPIFDREATWMNPDTCIILTARNMRRQGLEPESRKACATISDPHNQGLCFDPSIK